MPTSHSENCGKPPCGSPSTTPWTSTPTPSLPGQKPIFASSLESLLMANSPIPPRKSGGTNFSRHWLPTIAWSLGLSLMVGASIALLAWVILMGGL